MSVSPTLRPPQIKGTQVVGRFCVLFGRFCGPVSLFREPLPVSSVPVQGGVIPHTRASPLLHTIAHTHTAILVASFLSFFFLLILAGLGLR